MGEDEEEGVSQERGRMVGLLSRRLRTMESSYENEVGVIDWVGKVFYFCVLIRRQANNIDTSRGTTRYEVEHKQGGSEGGGRGEERQSTIKESHKKEKGN